MAASSPPPDPVLIRHARRLVTVPLYVGATVLVTALAPVLLPLCWVVSLRPRSRGALRSGAFVLCYLWCESIGIATAGWLWLRYGAPKRASGAPTRADGERWDRFLDANFQLQCWWANALKRAAETLFSLHFTVEGTEVLGGAPVIMLPRHASIADTVIPMVFYAIPQRTRLRYVLKRELLLDPCLDIVGNRLPNCFIARSGEDAKDDVERITTLARDAPPDEGFLIYPEGTRFSAQRRQRILERLAPRSTAAELARMQAWTELLPPRPGGTAALIAAAPSLDLVFCAHSGFEGASHFSTLINGSWTGANVHIRFWRIARCDVPLDATDQRAFLFAQWDRMQQTVVELQRLRHASPTTQQRGALV